MTLPHFKIMGVVNLTQDSFSDGGLFYKTSSALKQVEGLIESGADYIDLGAESTRPGAVSVSQEEEWKKLDEILSLLEKRDLGHVQISIDTRKPELMKRLLDRGIHMINHVADEMLDVDLLRGMAERNLAYMAMHIYKSPENMQAKPLGEEASLEAVSLFFENYFSKLQSCGFEKEKIYFDPGIGFGKTDQANYSLMNEVKNYSKEYNIGIGISRKSFMGRTLGLKKPMDRDKPSKILELSLSFLGAKIIRTHNVKDLSCLRYR